MTVKKTMSFDQLYCEHLVRNLNERTGKKWAPDCYSLISIKYI